MPLTMVALLSAGSLGGCAADPQPAIPLDPIGPSVLTRRGVSLSGAEFGSAVPGVFGADYTYPTHAEVDYYVGKGMTIMRIPFRWERVQPTLSGPFDETELARLDDIVSYTLAVGSGVLLDPHNYARYDDVLIGYATVTAADFADFWGKLADHYKDNTKIDFGLMNEPHSDDASVAGAQKLRTEDWVAAANGAIQAIRATGALNLITVSGNGWDTASGWNDTWYGSPNGNQLLNIVDPADNFAFEAHQYMDSDGSGTSGTCVASNTGSTRLTAFTAWLRGNKRHGFLGEFGGGPNETCLAAIDDMLTHIDTYADVYLGWTWWGAGPWWGPNYIFTVEPNATTGADQPQMGVLVQHL
ncbi:MAG TPA: glycoside hydrolase family 5 protein [Polyangia bacterium]